MYTVISATFANEGTDLETGTYPRIRNYEQKEPCSYIFVSLITAFKKYSL